MSAMTTNALVLVLLAGCTHALHVPPSWPDTAAELGALECALAREYGTEIALEVTSVRILGREGYPFPGRYDHGRIPTIYLDYSARSARASALRHEMLWHRTPDVVEDDPMPCWPCGKKDHDPRWTPTAERLEARVEACRSWR